MASALPLRRHAGAIRRSARVPESAAFAAGPFVTRRDRPAAQPRLGGIALGLLGVAQLASQDLDHAPSQIVSFHAIAASRLALRSRDVNVSTATGTDP
ncbi:MAG: hypothetical protein M5U08_13535 [Burkholderiales bacterium]|nr:hypothetical protein [Burkholderiales bacterium]